MHSCTLFLFPRTLAHRLLHDLRILYILMFLLAVYVTRHMLSKSQCSLKCHPSLTVCMNDARLVHSTCVHYLCCVYTYYRYYNNLLAVSRLLFFTSNTHKQYFLFSVYFSWNFCIILFFFFY